MKSTQYRRGRHSVTLLYTHLVFVTKYRKKVFANEHIEYMTEVCTAVAKKMGFKLVQLNGESDHIHVLIEYPPKLSISQIVNSLKGVSSRMLRQKYDLKPHVEHATPLNGGQQRTGVAHLWSPSYFAVSCGGAPLAKIKEYITNQNKPSTP